MKKVNNILLLFVVIVIAITALVLFFAPSSKEAALTGWDILGISKPQFKMMHKIFGPAFLILAINHIRMNFFAIKSYIKNSNAKFPSQQFIIAFAMLIVLLLASLVFGA